MILHVIHAAACEPFADYFASVSAAVSCQVYLLVARSAEGAARFQVPATLIMAAWQVGGRGVKGNWGGRGGALVTAKGRCGLGGKGLPGVVNVLGQKD
jgi:hypothetical protein